MVSDRDVLLSDFCSGLTSIIIFQRFLSRSLNTSTLRPYTYIVVLSPHSVCCQKINCFRKRNWEKSNKINVVLIPVKGKRTTVV